MGSRIIVIGLDAATMDLIEPWAEAGHLPTLARLLNEGTSGRLLSTPNMHSASAWTSILTGLNPGRHGLFVFSDRDFATGRQTFFTGGDRVGETIASHLARQGLAAGLLNVPMTYPAEGEPGGFLVSGLDAPSLNRDAFYPPELREDLLARFPDYNYTPKALGQLMAAGRVEEAVSAWTRLIEIQTDAAEYLVGSRRVDFFMIVYTASDWAGHNLWRYCDKTHHEYDSSQAARFGDLLLMIYRALDSAIAQLLALTDHHCHVFVISDHGMGPHTGAAFHLCEWLESNGYLVRKHQSGNSRSLAQVGRSLASRLLPEAVKEWVKAGLGSNRINELRAQEKDAYYSAIDWSRTTAYSEPGRHIVNINLRGRNCHGTVDPDEYDELRSQIASRLVEWRDEQGRQAVSRVWRREEVYHGPFVGRASDLYVEWNPHARLPDPPAEVRARGHWWSGDHRPDGLLICRGPGIRRGARVSGATVYDLVPTILYLGGLAVPDGLDGRVLDGVCTSGFLENNPLRRAGASGERSQGAVALNPSEEKLVEEKLRELGYL